MKQCGLTAGDGLEQACRDTRPAPAPDGGAPRGCAELRACCRRKSEQFVQLRGKVARVSVREARQVPVLRGVLGFQALGDLGEPRVASDERRRACSSCFRSDHSEGLGENGRDRKSTRLNSSHTVISYAVFCLKKKKERKKNKY